MNRTWLKTASVLVGLGLWAAAAESFAGYSIQDLGTLGTGFISSVSSSGIVVGTTVINNSEHAFLWEKGVITDLGSELMWADDVNARGQVVGGGYPPEGSAHGYLWENGVTTVLPTLGGSTNWVHAISDRGEVVGTSTLSGSIGPYHAYLWRDGEIRDLGTLGGNSSASSINNRGEVVGHYFTADRHNRACLWRLGDIVDIGTLGGFGSYAADINNLGMIVGNSQTPTGETHAFLWQDGTMTDLGTLGGHESIASGINDRGQIVGYSSTAEPTTVHAVLWEHGTMKDLGTLGGQSTASRINERGWIVGISETAPGENHAVIWVPTERDAGPSPTPSASRASSLPNHRESSSSALRAVLARNPNSTVTLSFVAPRAGNATVRLFDVSGRLVREIWSARSVGAGRQDVLIDGKTASGAPLPSGVYYYRVEMRGWSLPGKVVISR